MDIQPDRRLMIVHDSSSGELIGIDVLTGQPAWRTALTRGTLDFAIAGNYIVGASILETAVYCVEYASGRILWKGATTGGMNGNPQVVIDGPRVYVSRAGVIDCFAGDGTRCWSFKLTGAHKSIGFGFPGNVRPLDHT